MQNQNLKLKNAIDFHGHLGPYLVLGLLAGECALRKLKCNKYFGVEVRVWGATVKPKSCFIDGLQLSTGATYGKGNINKFKGNTIKAEIKNCLTNKKVVLRFKPTLIAQLKAVKTHAQSEELARKLIKTNYSEIFKLTAQSSQPKAHSPRLTTGE